MKNALRILHLEDNSNDAELVRSVLEEDQLICDIDRVVSKTEFERALQSNIYDIILSDYSMPGFDGFKALSCSRLMQPSVPFLFLSGTIGEERAVDSLRNGATDYILKDRLQRLGAAIRRARREAEDRVERLKNDQKIRQQADFLNQAQDAIYVGDLSQNITYWNKGAERIYGWTADEVIGKHASKLLYKSDAPSRDEIWNTVLEKGQWTGELVQVTMANKEICVSSRRTLLRDSGGVAVAVLNINTDITEKKNLEAQVLRSQRLQSLGTMASGIAHDLNNVLAPVLMVSELLGQSLTDSQDLKMVDIARSSAQRGTQLVNQILQFARGTRPADVQMNLKALVDELAKFALSAFPRKISIRTDVQPDLFPVAGDSTQFTQILLNLCVNARDAMPNGGRLSICIKNTLLSEQEIFEENKRISGSFVELSVSDTGTGIPPEALTHIFEPFFTTKADGKGTGLGLSTVATIVRNHGGFIDVETGLGTGTTFRVYFPVTNQALMEKHLISSASVQSGHGEWVLLVDDEFALLEMTKGLLESHDYHVLTAKDGAEALAVFDAHQDKIAVLITDLLMPGLGGAELIANVCERFPRIVAICLSGSPDRGSFPIPGKNSYTFLRKPCSTTDLLGTLQRLLAARKS
ncbi:MAG: signal transduction histidine kinase, nitrogen specific, NtrB [Verrucomicrobiales bacterium]|nr:signal transduction histidine kinase, nitrogen specific, NtrB [Verrucomicrobiales bacterium]